MSVEKSQGSLEKIGKLEGPSDFIKWDQDIRDYLAMNGYGKLMTTQAQPPEDATKLELWEDKQERACGIIRNRCGFNAREEVKGKEHAHEMLQTLKKRFRPKGSAIFQHLDAKFKELHLENCKGVSDFAEKLREARNEIQGLDETCRISEPHFVNKFLTGLGPPYTVFLTSFYQTYTLIPSRDDENRVTERAVSFDVTGAVWHRARNVQSKGFNSNIIIFHGLKELVPLQRVWSARGSIYRKVLALWPQTCDVIPLLPFFPQGHIPPVSCS